MTNSMIRSGLSTGKRQYFGFLESDEIHNDLEETNRLMFDLPMIQGPFKFYTW